MSRQSPSTRTPCVRPCRSVSFSLVLLIAPAAIGQQFVEQSASRFPVPNPSEWTNQLTIGDIDNDGDLDLIFANGGNFSSAGTNLPQRIYINNGSGVFTDQSLARLNFSGLCRGAELGDIDNDGDLDLVFAQDFERVPQLFQNDGTGHFTNITATNLPQIQLSSSRAQFGDVDNDGDMDLYITSGTNNRFGCDLARLYINDGTGMFADETADRLPPDSICENMDCIFGDVDNDFDIDVLVGARGAASRLYKNDGAGNFTSSPFPPEGNTYSYDFGDIDGDGDLDLLGANAGSSNSEQLLRNEGNGAFTNISNQLLFNPNTDDNDSKFFDYDNDGDLDIIIAALGAPERIYNNNGSATFSNTSGVIQLVSDSSLDVKVADLTGDGRIDIVSAQGESSSPFLNRIYVNMTGAPDSIDPRVIATEDLEDSADILGSHVVRALVLDDASSDRNAPGLSAVLNYRINAGEYVQTPMHHSGGQVYRGVIPAQTCGGLIEYYVTATDFAGNTTDGPIASFNVASAPLAIHFPSGVPQALPACTDASLDVSIFPCTESVATASVFFRTTENDAFTEIPLLPVEGTLYRASLPAFTCAATPQFYVQVTGDGGATVHSPEGAPAVFYAPAAGIDGDIVLLEEGFEAGLPAGWTQSGLWNVTDQCDLSTGLCNEVGDSVAYYGIVSQCNYETGGVHAGDMITAPVVLPPAEAGPITLTYCSTYQRHIFPNGDRPELFLNNGSFNFFIDDPSRFAPVAPQLVWTQRTVDLTPWAGQTITLIFKFGNISFNQDQFLGWQVDDVRIFHPGIICNGAPVPGDLNGDDLADGLDLQIFVDAVLLQSTAIEHVCPADFDHDGVLTPADAEAFAAALLQG